MMKIATYQTADAPQEISVPESSRQVIIEDGFAAAAGESSTHITIGPGAAVVLNLNLLVNREVKRSIILSLHDQSRLDIAGIVAGEGDGLLNLSLEIQHKAASVGKTILHGIARESSYLGVNGKIRIDQGADGSDAYLEGRFLLHGSDAKGKIIPSLEILAQDVRASHAAASGPIDPEMLFYLRSRGCTLNEAESMVVAGFVSSVFRTVPPSRERDAIMQRWQKALSLHIAI